METLSYNKKLGNIGGIKQKSLVLVPLKNIIATTRTEVVYTSATSPLFILETAEHVEKSKTDEKGTSITHNINFNIAKNRTDLRDWIKNNIGKYFYIQYQDANGFSIEIPIMKLDFTFQTGNQFSNLNKFEFALVGTTILPANTARTLVLPAQISISPTTLDFGTVKVGNTSTATFTVTNTGAQNLIISSISLPTGYTTSGIPSYIEAGESHTFTITFTPTTGVSYSGTITINSNAINSTNTVSVTGEGFVLKGLFFDGINDYIKIPNATPIQLDFADSFTFNYFIKFNSTGFYIFQEFSSAMYSFSATLNSNRIDFYKMQGNQYVLDWIKGNTDIVQNQLYMITLINKGLGASNLEIYINAVKETPTIQFNDSITGTTNSDLYIGGRAGSFNLAGNIYDFKLFDKALSLSEIESLYDFEMPATAVGNLVLHIPFETLNKVGSNVFTPDLIAGNNAQLIGYSTGAKGIVGESNNDIQLVP